jgi:hypothetical protein
LDCSFKAAKYHPESESETGQASSLSEGAISCQASVRFAFKYEQCHASGTLEWAFIALVPLMRFSLEAGLSSLCLCAIPPVKANG